VKLDFTFDPALERISELKESREGGAGEPQHPSSTVTVSAAKDMDMKVSP